MCLTVTSTAPLVIPTPPTIALVGQSLLTIPQGTAYALCPTPTPTSAVCDRGATASDSLDGDLTSLIEACDTSTARSVLASHSMLQLSCTSALHLGCPDQAPTCHNWVATSSKTVADRLECLKDALGCWQRTADTGLPAG